VRGRVSGDAREATITVTVLPAESGRTSLDVRAVIDTGFTGDLALPTELVSSLSLPERGFVEVRLADGSTAARRLHEASILWHGVPRRVLVYQVDADALVGMSLLRGSTVSIDVVPDGHVTITDPHERQRW
jgi:clan AA aspartic protease